MISKVSIVNNKNTPLRYLSKVSGLSNGVFFDFRPGVNIIVGNNGCGKSSLLKLISWYCLCKDSMCSSIDLSSFGKGLKLNPLFDNNDNLKDGAKIKCDYNGVVYNYNSIIKKELSTINEFHDYFNSADLSDGEKGIHTLQSMFDTAFKKTDVQFPIKKILEYKKSCNTLWKKRFTSLLNYYKNNQLHLTQNEFEYTFLMDEPDKNLDIKNIQNLYRVLSYKKEYIQIICVIHNPLLIYHLLKKDHINFIEMSENYIRNINLVFNNL